MTVADALHARLMARLIELQNPVSRLLRWVASRAAYVVAATGHVLGWETVQAADGAYRSFLGAQMAATTEAFIAGEITLEVWQVRMAHDVKRGWIASSLAGSGGANAVDPLVIAKLEDRLGFELAHLDQFADEIAAGALTAGQIKARSTLYGNASRTAFYDGFTAAQMRAGRTEERRVLRPAEHCLDCVEYAERGWVPIGTLPEPGEGSACMRNCACVKEYR